MRIGSTDFRFYGRNFSRNDVNLAFVPGVSEISFVAKPGTRFTPPFGAVRLIAVTWFGELSVPVALTPPLQDLGSELILTVFGPSGGGELLRKRGSPNPAGLGISTHNFFDFEFSQFDALEVTGGASAQWGLNVNWMVYNSTAANVNLNLSSRVIWEDWVATHIY